MLPRVVAHLLLAVRLASIFSLQRAAAAAYVCMSQRCPIYLYSVRVASSACLDVAIFVLANQVFWRLFYHVRLCCCLLVGSDWALVVESCLE